MRFGAAKLSKAGMVASSVAFLALAACGGLPKPAKEPAFLPELAGQNWSDDDKRRWYAGSQGSRLIPEKWLLALEEVDSEAPFMSARFFERYGYLPNPYRKTLPIGFAVDAQPDDGLPVTSLRWYEGQGNREPWVGLNCAACHTTQISYGGRAEIIEGAPTLADFQGFTEALVESMRRTASDGQKWSRFAAAVLKDADTEGNRGQLRDAFEMLLNHHELREWYNSTGSHYGPGRLDAVGHILNKVAMLNDGNMHGSTQRPPLQFRGEPDAPVSYPFIWNANQHDFVQWNGIVPNQKLPIGKREIDFGALVRNTSEVIGVFGDVATRQYPGLEGYRSSIDVDNLERMEDQLGRLASPAWLPFFPAIDERRKRLGEQLFRQNCADCHQPLSRNDLKTPIKAQMTPIWGPGGVGTDPWMVCNAFTYRAFSGRLEGTKDLILDGSPHAVIGPMNSYLKTQSVGILLRQKDLLPEIFLAKLLNKDRKIKVAPAEEIPIEPDARPPQPQQKPRALRLAECEAASSSPRSSGDQLRILAYKARPLNGIWATAPYLHNGSVKSLWELLLPPQQRARAFWVGNRDFDPKHVGFRDEPTSYGFWFRTHDDRGQPIHGNSNDGHDYGNARLTDEERWALVEYMKSL